MPATRETMAAPRAGITGIHFRSASTTSTPSNGMANARAATLDGPGMTAMERGGRETALAKLMAGGSGISRSKVTTLVATRAKVTTGSLKPIIMKGVPTTPGEQNYLATVHLAAESTCANYLAYTIRPSAERLPGGALFILKTLNCICSFHFAFSNFFSFLRNFAL